ncbi:MAG: class I SAM-dependent methyltransferase [Betaproteobacteria bacterium]|nr:class I SAM-dependent methyltransferase [Betaproteobacteria bacterium]
MNRRGFLAGIGALGAAAGCSTPGVKLDAPYIATPYAVVEEMLQLAKVGPSDVVYDLGCGDGRIVIAAAERFGARGVGIDIDPRRIEEANAAARRAGVAGRVRFAVQDLFQTDFSEATVVSLYLYPELNQRLRPKLLADLKPGSRIVSHDYGIGDWKPHRTQLVTPRDSDQVAGRDRQHWIYLWIVPPP